MHAVFSLWPLALGGGGRHCSAPVWAGLQEEWSGTQANRCKDAQLACKSTVLKVLWQLQRYKAFNCSKTERERG